MFIDNWAAKWSVPWQAVEELKESFGLIAQETVGDTKGLSEQAVLNLVRLEASKKGLRLWRNNVGAAYMQDGSFLRYGLANESKTINTQIKSADLIGIRRVHITQPMVGTTIGQFVSREIKAANWEYKGTDREVAQLKWGQLITSYGGDARFANGEGTL